MNKVISTIFCLVFTVVQAYTQCAMCKGSAETSLENGNSAAAGINTGVLYLLAFPLLFLSLFGFFLWKRSKAEREQNL